MLSKKGSYDKTSMLHTSSFGESPTSVDYLKIDLMGMLKY